MQNTTSPTSLMGVLKHPITYLFGMILIMAWTGVHSFRMYQFSRPNADIVELGLVIFGIVAIEFLVLIFTINDQREAAIAYAFATFVITLFVHWMEVSLPDRIVVVDGISKVIEGRAFSDSNWIYFLPGFIYASMFSFGQYYMADRFYQYELELEEARRFPVNSSPENELSVPENVLEILESQLSKLRDSNQEQSRSLESALSQKNKVERELSEWKEASVPMEKVADLASVTQCAIDAVIDKEGLLNTKLDTLRKNASNWKQRVYNGAYRGNHLIEAKYKMELYNRAYNLVKAKQQEAA